MLPTAAAAAQPAQGRGGSSRQGRWRRRRCSASKRKHSKRAARPQQPCRRNIQFSGAAAVWAQWPATRPTAQPIQQIHTRKWGGGYLHLVFGALHGPREAGNFRIAIKPAAPLR